MFRFVSSLRSAAPFAAPAVALTALCLFSPAAHAQTLVIGSGGNGNGFPFGSTYVGEYQQIYGAGSFSGPITITQIAFASSDMSNGGAYNFTGTLGLGTTAATPAAPGTSYAANKRPDFVSVFSGTQTATLLNTNTFDLVFNVTPFVYDPTQGSLLLDIVNTSSSGSFFFDSNTADTNLNSSYGRLYNNTGNGAVTPQANGGLRTRFTFTPAAVGAPEPGSLALLGGGLLSGLGYAGAVRRRKATAK